MTSSEKGLVQNRKSITGASPGARRRFIIAQRDPWHLPDDKIELPSPAASPFSPPNINWLTTLLPPCLMLVSTIVSAIFGAASGNKTPLYVILPMLLMSLGFPITNLINLGQQRKKYKKALAQREEEYKKLLQLEKNRLDELVHIQRSTLETQYPPLKALYQITRDESLFRKKLWLRRPHDADFLSLRLGTGFGTPSFTVEAVRHTDTQDRLPGLAQQLVKEYETLPDIPMMLPLAEAGSVGVTSRSPQAAFGEMRRLLVELLFHHSPQDVQIAVITEGEAAAERWDWLKWAPHTRALEPEESLRRLAFTPESVDACLEWLMEEFKTRQSQREDAKTLKATLPAIVVVLDDSGAIRQRPAIAKLAGAGVESGIYMFFTGSPNWPRECRSRLEINEDHFRYIETWGGEGGGLSVEGSTMAAERADSEQLARTLAGLEVVGPQTAVPLPDSIRVTEVLGAGALNAEMIKQRWSRQMPAIEMLQFPIGLRLNRDSLEPMIIDLRPEEIDGRPAGKAAYHSVLIGTTGSGKSVFLQSLVLAAAHKYSPVDLNFLLMDFKAGASPLSLLRTLPHVVGLVTDLGPELAERALAAIDNEFSRRKRLFEEAGNPPHIWDYNKKFPSKPMAHLLLVLDEFARGIELMPETMPKVLQTLATQGRALGMYMLLANQKVNSAVESLLANVGWRIVLRVSDREEMRIVDATRPMVKKPGRGYAKVKEEVFEFQGARSDQQILSASSENMEEFRIYEVGMDGSRKSLYKYSAEESTVGNEGKTARLSELDALLGVMKETSSELNLRPARQIYLDPLPAMLPLEEVIDDSSISLAFQDGKWTSESSGNLVAPTGIKDIPEACIQECLRIDFSQQDGHLWIIGAPGSGKVTTLTTIVMSLAKTHSPAEVQFYVFDFSGGGMRPLEGLPHIGAIIRPTEQERIERLLAFLEGELDRRTSTGQADQELRNPALFLVINNFAEIRENFPDHVDRISRLTRDGKTANIHLVIATNRASELSRTISSNIARRIVLQMASRDEYFDAVGRNIPQLSLRSEGRGYWVDQTVSECQVALAGNIKESITGMRAAWKGPLPQPVETLPTSISLDEILADLRQPKKAAEGLLIPVGKAYDDLKVIAPNILEELPHWLVLGPRQSGKSNLLGVAAETVLGSAQNGWEIFLFALRRGPLVEWALKQKRIQLASTLEKAIAQCKEIITMEEQADPKKRLMVLMDDLGSAFEAGREEFANSLNTLAEKCGACSNFTIMATSVVEELRMQQSTPLVRALRQSRTGIGLTKDSTELDWLGYQLPMNYRKLEFAPGRGFWISKGKGCILQTPLCEALKKGK